MKLTVTTDPAKVRVRNSVQIKDLVTGEMTWDEGECIVLQEDADGAKAFAKELYGETNPQIRRQWEHDYYADIKERYASGHVAGALLMIVWDFEKKIKEFREYENE